MRFPNLSLNCWAENSLGRLGSVLGVPLCADECTSQQSQISYARLLIEIDVTKPLDSVILVEGGHGVVFEQEVTYEWVPHFCVKCNQVGHNCERQHTVKKRKKHKRVWVPKKNKEPPEVTSGGVDEFVAARTDCVQQQQSDVGADVQVSPLRMGCSNQSMQQGHSLLMDGMERQMAVVVTGQQQQQDPHENGQNPKQRRPLVQGQQQQRASADGAVQLQGQGHPLPLEVKGQQQADLGDGTEQQLGRSNSPLGDDLSHSHQQGQIAPKQQQQMGCAKEKNQPRKGGSSNKAPSYPYITQRKHGGAISPFPP